MNATVQSVICLEIPLKLQVDLLIIINKHAYNYVINVMCQNMQAYYDW